MKIAMLGHKRIPSREGGVEVVVEEIASRMVSKNHEVTCFNRSGHHVSGLKYDSEKMSNYNGIKIRSVVTLDFKGLAAITSSISAAFISAFNDYDIIHFHAEGPCVMLWLPKLFDKRCIVTIHGLDHKRAKWGCLASAYILLGEKCAVKYADEIIVLSRNAQKYFNDVYGRSTTIIPNAVNRPIQMPAKIIQKKYDLCSEGYILYLGRLVPEKGLSYLIEAFKKVVTNKKLVIAGGVSDSDEYKETLENMAITDNRIIFTGFVQGIELAELYSNAYFYVLPSDLEGMPLSLLEAMSYGNCCLVSSIPECVEMVENRAVIFEKSNVGDLIEKLQMLCNDEKLVASYRNGITDFICTKYNWDNVVEQTLALYQRNQI